MTSRLKKFQALSKTEKKTFIYAFFTLPIIRLRLRIWGAEKSLARLRRLPVTPRQGGCDTSIDPVRTSRLINRAARIVFRRESCLERSIMLWHVLRRKGIKSDIKIGVSTGRPGLQAHAWVEIDGKAINEIPHVKKKFAAFDSPFTSDHKDVP